MYKKVAHVMSKPAFINVIKTFHKLLNHNENYAEKDDIVERINYIAHILSLIPLADLVVDATPTLDPDTVKKAQTTLEDLDTTTDVATIDFAALFNFVSKNFKNMNGCTAALVENNKLTIHDNAIYFITSAIPLIAAYEM